MSFASIPAVYLMQLVILAVASNLPLRALLIAALVASAALEETVKTMGIAVLIERGETHSLRQIVWLAFLSALGFLAGEKLLTLVSVSVVSQAFLATALFSGGLLLVPLAAHFSFTAIIVLLYARFRRVPYWVALSVGVILHTLYNALILGGAL